ncbi:LysR family transcriptional regulator [Klebsiella pneumoniae]|uniref:helix-turn-helix domain-containing protein n=1 Tax=Klebsiella pneumoniae TaxID=573 RepID=UPI0020CC8081|nr:LysR family transcriptional regulator [Klebsiella pneumoniae]MCQ0861036.1 LysR family transcriptional regulator [Klebsiella pneumoniae]
MQPLPSLKLLQVFACVVENQAYSRAQQALNMTTPAISAYMSELETQLGRGDFTLGVVNATVTDSTLDLPDAIW